METSNLPSRKPSSAMRFIVLMGLVSLFADMTYEAARSLNGPYLATLGAAGAVVGFTAGLGELAGYGLRLLSGLLSDKTRQYWLLTIVGYAVNLAAVPLLALAGRWELAAVLMVTERVGKAVRAPARDAMLSHAAAAVGTGWGFALHEAMDQIGALLGPLIVMIVLALKGTYANAYAVLAIPAGFALLILLLARVIFPRPKELDPNAHKKHDGPMPRVFWFYLAAVALIAAGFADFPLIAFHIKKNQLFADHWIPLLYACAMGIDGLAALFFGRWYDTKKLTSLIAAVALSCLFAWPAFSFSPFAVVAGILLWGIGMGAQESILRAFVADTVPADRRGTGFGIFNAGYGLAWFLGSAVMGILYDVSVAGLIGFSIAAQMGALPLLYSLRKPNREVS